MPSQRSTSLGLKPVHLGIDHGTTFTRVRLLAKGKDRQPEIISESFGARTKFDSKHRIRGTQTVPDFPAFCLPGHSGPSTPSSFEIQQSPNRVPLKLASLILDDGDDVRSGKPRSTLLKLMPRHHHNLLQFKEQDPRFNERLMETWSAHFEHIKDRVVSYCKENEYKLASITITQPNWSNDEKVDHIYQSIIASVFESEVSVDNIFTINEAQAMARCLIKEQLNRKNSQLTRLVGQRDMLLVVDIGGTAMNGCLFEVCRDGDTIHTTYELEAFGYFGGSELWEMAIAEKLVQNEPRTLDDDVLSAYLCDFADNKAMVTSPDNSILLEHKGEIIEVSPEEARSAFDNAFHGALEELEFKLRLIVARLDHANRQEDLAIILTGGTFSTHCIQKHVRSLVKKIDPGQKCVPIFLNQLMETHIVDPTGLIARGAVYAMISTKTVKQFMKSGAAFAVQTSNTKDGKWDEEMLALDGKYVRIGVHGEYPSHKMRKGERFKKIALKVVCDPLHGDRAEDETLSFVNCYDVFAVDPAETATPGSYRFSIQSWSTGPTCGLRLTVEHVEGSVRWDGSRQRAVRKEWTLPLRYDIGSGCALVDFDHVQEGAWVEFHT